MSRGGYKIHVRKAEDEDHTREEPYNQSEFAKEKATAKKKDENVTQSKDSTDTHKLQANGMQSRDNKQANKKPQKQGMKALKWYQRTIYHIGFLCCVAVIIYAIFLYLRRKK